MSQAPYAQVRAPAHLSDKGYINDTPPSTPPKGKSSPAIAPPLAPTGVSQMIYPQPRDGIVVGQPVGEMEMVVKREQGIPDMIFLIIGIELVLLAGVAVQLLLQQGRFPSAAIGAGIFSVVVILLSQQEAFRSHTITLDTRSGSMTIQSLAVQHKWCGIPAPAPRTFRAVDVSSLGWLAVGKHGNTHLLFFTVNGVDQLVWKAGGGCNCGDDSEIREAVQFWTVQLARCGGQPRQMGRIRKHCHCA